MIARHMVPGKILAAGTWASGVLEIPRREVFRTYTSRSLVLAHAAKDMALATRHDSNEEGAPCSELP